MLNTSKESGNMEPKKDNLCVFGYQCKLFERSECSDGELLLISHQFCLNGTQSQTLIDRFDIRHHLWKVDGNKRSIAQTSLNALGFDEMPRDPLPDRTEELPDLKDEKPVVEEPYEEIDCLRLPYKIVKPSTKRQHALRHLCKTIGLEPFISLKTVINKAAIIECTARYVTEHGTQMEILVKTKQAKNEQFDFLKYDHALFPYYQHMKRALSEGWILSTKDLKVNSKGQEVSECVTGPNDESDDSDNEGYLHPILTRSQVQPPSTSSNQTDQLISVETPYSRLVQSVGEINRRIHENSKKNCPTSPIPRQIIPPPPDVLEVLDKLADCVARKGSSFEEIASMQSVDRRFDFLNPTNIYNPYYVMKKQMAEENLKDAMQKSQVKFTINPSKRKLQNGASPLSNPFQPSNDGIELDLEIEASCDERLKKQKERRRKAKLFVELLKRRKEE